MALLPSKKELEKLKQKRDKNSDSGEPKDIVINDDVTIDYGERKYTAKERKPVQVDPPVLKLLSDISYAKDEPIYKVVAEAANLLVDNFSEDEKRIYQMRTQK